MFLLGIDIGTSSTKSAIFDCSGNLISLAARTYTFEVAKSGYAEQDPEDWWKATAESIVEAIQTSGIDKQQIKAIGLSGQMHGLVCLAGDGKVVRKAILHCDVRSKTETDEILDVFGKEYSDIVYNPIFSGFQAVSLYWIRKHEPDNYAQIKKIICPKDYIRYRLTGEIGTEHTDASGTLFYDILKSCWSPIIFERLGFEKQIVPDKIHNSTEIAGEVTCDAAKATGLATGTSVVYGGGDQAMHSVGNGIYKAHTLMATIGTSGQVLAITNNPIKNPMLNTHTFRHVVEGSWFGLGAMLSAGSTLNWYQQNFAENFTYKELDAMAETISPCSNGLVFFPCMGGERTPYLDPKARGMFTGVSMMHTRAHFTRAIMEGVSFGMKSSLDIMNSLYGKEEKLICAGGGVKGLTWAQIQADIYGRDIYLSKTKEQACLGAAIVAGIGIGLFRNISEACEEMCDMDMKIIHPNERKVERYQDMYDSVYKRIYNQNAEIFHELANFSSAK